MEKKFVVLDVLLAKTSVCVIAGYSKIMNEAEALTRWLVNLKSSIFVRTSRDGKKALEVRLSDKHVTRLIKSTVLKSGIRAELPGKDRLALFSGHSLRAGLASSAEGDERYVQKQLGHTSAEMTRRYQRHHERFRGNLTKAAGLQRCPTAFNLRLLRCSDQCITTGSAYNPKAVTILSCSKAGAHLLCAAPVIPCWQSVSPQIPLTVFAISLAITLASASSISKKGAASITASTEGSKP
jgi:hypothetical protein